MSEVKADLQKIVLDWAWREYDETANWSQRRLRSKDSHKGKKYIGINIDWSRVKFNDTTEWRKLLQENFDDEASEMVTKMAPDAGKTHTSILFHTTYRNNTDSPQEYTFKTEKTTRSIMSTEIGTCFTKGYDMSVKLALPNDIMEMNAGYKRETSLSRSEGEVIEEEMTWGIESQISVRKNYIAEAELVVREKKYSGHFNIKSRINGYVTVTFNNLRDNNALLKATGNDITDIMKRFVKMETNQGKNVDFIEVEGREVVITTSGKCKFRYGFKQEVRVTERSMDVNN